MNWPNRLSILRVCCVPVLILLLALSEPWCRWAAAAAIASLENRTAKGKVVLRVRD